ncbi:Vacuolar protein sorting-associated protein 20 [Podospora pseudopauciseta]|uniref:Vacuolar protein sorting-associated protein 20 n=1 Tax=Podospora pseudopauciseta TaxID=2093780 RepID=A0ABR0HHS4_9PEZI|nr:Vacuolar protein sorting-associated protein 20 [Podospora pseudopauciseta]
MGGNSSKITAQDQAIYDLKLQRDRLHQYQRRITLLTSRETEIARALLAQNNRPRALLALRRKKYQESLLAKTDQQLEQLEKLVSSVEFALIQKDVVFGLQQGTKVLKEIHAEMGGIDKVEKLMGETAEEVEYQREVSEMLGGKISVQDEEEVEEELAALERELGEPMKKKEETPSRVVVEGELPDVPGTELPAGEQRQEGVKKPVAERREAVAA